jgi:hypothetical protein
MGKKVGRFSGQSQELRSAVKRIVEVFRLTDVKEEADAYGLEVLLQNNFAGVKFEFSPQSGAGWRAVVGRLSDGQFPKHPIHIDRHTVVNRFDLRDVAAAKIDLIPELAEKIGSLAPLTAIEICSILERCCADIFQGDFSSFAKLRDRVMERLPLSASSS